MGRKLKQALTEADDIEAAEADQAGRPIPPHVKVSRPNRARSKVLQVRLNPEEFAAVERLAAARGLPPSTVAREKLLELVAADAGSDQEDVAAQLLAAAAAMSELAQRVARQLPPA